MIVTTLCDARLSYYSVFNKEIHSITNVAKWHNSLWQQSEINTVSVWCKSGKCESILSQFFISWRLDRCRSQITLQLSQRKDPCEHCWHQ